MPEKHVQPLEVRVLVRDHLRKEAVQVAEGDKLTPKQLLIGGIQIPKALDCRVEVRMELLLEPDVVDRRPGPHTREEDARKRLDLVQVVDLAIVKVGLQLI